MNIRKRHRFAVVLASLGIAVALAGCSSSPEEPIAKPSPSVTPVDLVKVPDVVGMPGADAYDAVYRLGLQVKMVNGTISSESAVVSQYPPMGTEVARGATVTLTLADIGTRDNPAAWDTTLTFDVGTVSLDKAMWEANEAVAAANHFNKPVPDGMTYVLLPVTVTNVSSTEPLSPWIAITVIYVAADGTSYDSDGQAPPNSLLALSDLYEGGTATGNLLFAIPLDAIGTGVWGIKYDFGDPHFLASHGMESVDAPGIQNSGQASGSKDASGSASSSSSSGGSSSSVGSSSGLPKSSSTPSFDIDSAKLAAGYVVDDIATADERMLDRPDIGGSSAMRFLAQDMRRLESAGTPPGVDAANYNARINTLEDSFNTAAVQLDSDDIVGAAATYQVARDNVSPLLDILNTALGTSRSIPAWSYL